MFELDQTKGTNDEYLETPFSNLLARVQEGHFFHYLLIKNVGVCICEDLLPSYNSSSLNFPTFSIHISSV